MSNLVYVASRGILGIESNTANFKWAFGLRMPPADRAAFERCRVRIRLHVGSSQENARNDVRNGEELRGRYHHFSARMSDDALDFARPFVFGKYLSFRIEGLLRNELDIMMSESYHRLIVDKFLNVYSTGYMLTDLATVLLLRQGFAPLHSAALKWGDATVVLCAPSNTGKSLTAKMLCERAGAHLIAEDLAITDGVSIHAVPWTNSYRHNSQVKRNVLMKQTQRFMDACAPRRPQIKDTSGLPDGSSVTSNMLDVADITHVIFLEHGHASVTDASTTECVRRIVNFNSYQFNYRTAPVLSAYEYFNPELDIHAVRQVELSILANLADTAQERLIVSSVEPAMFAKMVADIIGATL